MSDTLGAQCVRCANEFDASDAKAEYDDEFGGDPDYDEQYGGEVCANCAIPDTNSNMALGSAISMWNGDEDCDPDVMGNFF